MNLGVDSHSSGPAADGLGQHVSTLGSGAWTILDGCMRPTDITADDSVRVVLLNPDPNVRYYLSHGNGNITPIKPAAPPPASADSPLQMHLTTLSSGIETGMAAADAGAAETAAMVAQLGNLSKPVRSRFLQPREEVPKAGKKALKGVNPTQGRDGGSAAELAASVDNYRDTLVSACAATETELVEHESAMKDEVQVLYQAASRTRYAVQEAQHGSVPLARYLKRISQIEQDFDRDIQAHSPAVGFVTNLYAISPPRVDCTNVWTGTALDGGLGAAVGGVDRPMIAGLSTFQKDSLDAEAAVWKVRSSFWEANRARVFGIGPTGQNSDVTVTILGQSDGSPDGGSDGGSPAATAPATFEPYQFVYHSGAVSWISIAVAPTIAFFPSNPSTVRAGVASVSLEGEPLSIFLGAHLCKAEQNPTWDRQLFWTRNPCEWLGMAVGFPIAQLVDTFGSSPPPTYSVFAGPMFWPIPLVSVTGGFVGEFSSPLPTGNSTNQGHRAAGGFVGIGIDLPAFISLVGGAKSVVAP